MVRYGCFLTTEIYTGTDVLYSRAPASATPTPVRAAPTPAKLPRRPTSRRPPAPARTQPPHRRRPLVRPTQPPAASRIRRPRAALLSTTLTASPVINSPSPRMAAVPRARTTNTLLPKASLHMASNRATLLRKAVTSNPLMPHPTRANLLTIHKANPIRHMAPQTHHSHRTAPLTSPISHMERPAVSPATAAPLRTSSNRLTASINMALPREDTTRTRPMAEPPRADSPPAIPDSRSIANRPKADTLVMAISRHTKSNSDIIPRIVYKIVALGG